MGRTIPSQPVLCDERRLVEHYLGCGGIRVEEYRYGTFQAAEEQQGGRVLDREVE